MNREIIDNKIEVQLYVINEFARLWIEEANLSKKADIYTLFCHYIHAITEANSYIEKCDFNSELIEAVEKEIKNRDNSKNDVFSCFFSHSIDIIKSSDDYKRRK